MNILIVYEIFNREYENAQLLASELQIRGHNVNIVSKSTCFRIIGDIDILIIPNCYTAENYHFYRYMTNAKNAIIINLQYEQVLSKNWEEIGYHNPKGDAKKAVTLCWGNNTYQRLLSNGVSEENLKITGAIHLDFLNSKFSSYYLSKNKIAKIFDLDTKKKWVLYISGFTVAADNGIVANGLLNSFKENKDSIQDFIEVSKNSRKITLEWLQKLLEEDENVYLLYRLHPNEIKDKTLSRIEEKYYGRFICIQNYSIKQWIYVSDIVITWFSTSIVESFYANKNCYILRPIDISKNMDSVIYMDADVISNYTKLKEIVSKRGENFSIEHFPISQKLISDYYNNDNQLAYIKVADVIEEMSSRNKERLPFNYYIERLMFLLTHNEPWKSTAEKVYRKFFAVFKIKLSIYSPWKKRYLSILEDRITNREKNKEEIDRKSKLLKTIVVNIKDKKR